jgi:hypothetical protein
MMGRLDPRSPTVGVEAAAALLASLDDASAFSTYLDENALSTPERPGIFELVERCRENVAALLGVEVERYLDDDGEAER